MNQPSFQPTPLPLAHLNTLDALLQKPHVPSAVPRFSAPAPKERKWKMVLVERVTFVETNVCRVCGDPDCGFPHRISVQKPVTSSVEERQYLDQ